MRNLWQQSNTICVILFLIYYYAAYTEEMLCDLIKLMKNSSYAGYALFIKDVNMNFSYLCEWGLKQST